MMTPLDRRLLIIQIKEDRNGCQAVVPVHPDVLRLDDLILADERYAQEALGTARGQFETEAGAYIEALMCQKPINPSLRLDKYRRWDDRWRFDFAPYNDILAMRWELDEPEPYEIGYVPMVCISNGIFTKQRRLVKIEDIEMAPNVTIFYGSTRGDDHLLLSREIMLEYETETPFPQQIHKEGDCWIDLAVGAFCSSYTRNVPQALLMRNWAVAYNNRLLEEASHHVH